MSSVVYSPAWCPLCLGGSVAVRDGLVPGVVLSAYPSGSCCRKWNPNDVQRSPTCPRTHGLLHPSEHLRFPLPRCGLYWSPADHFMAQICACSLPQGPTLHNFGLTRSVIHHGCACRGSVGLLLALCVSVCGRTRVCFGVWWRARVCVCVGVCVGVGVFGLVGVDVCMQACTCLLTVGAGSYGGRRSQ